MLSEMYCRVSKIKHFKGAWIATCCGFDCTPLYTMLQKHHKTSKDYLKDNMSLQFLWNVASSTFSLKLSFPSRDPHLWSIPSHTKDAPPFTNPCYVTRQTNEAISPFVILLGLSAATVPAAHVALARGAWSLFDDVYVLHTCWRFKHRRAHETPGIFNVENWEGICSMNQT